MARKFLYLVASCIVLVIVGSLAFVSFQDQLAKFAFVPSSEFTPVEPMTDNAYDDPALWFSRPGIGVSDPARWQPAFDDERVSIPRPAENSTAAHAVFFIHPTSYLSSDSWNAPLDDAESERVARIYIRGMASPFNGATEIWAPRYRQATMGAFLTDAPEAAQALDAAYSDVLEAFRFFLDSIDTDTPVVLAGHSQGALHLLRLLREQVKGSPLSDRLAAAYVIGWPISVDHDLPELGLPACTAPDQPGCILSWSSFAEPADPSSLIETYAASTGFDGTLRGNSQILCTNPLTGTRGGEAPASANLGTLVPDDSISNGELVPGSIPARCDERGILLVGDPPELGSYVLPGNNYHVYDIPMFWMNTKADVAARVEALVGARGSDLGTAVGDTN